MLTGEPVPVEVGEGAAVAGATINTSGRLVIEATKVGGDTALAQIARLVADAQSGKAPIQRLVDRVSAVFVPIVIALSLATLVGWLLLTGDASAAFTAAVAVLIIACPCALGLATPTALMVGTGRGAQLGILIRGPEVLEQTRRVTTIVLDKTGTVTEGTAGGRRRRRRRRLRPRGARAARRLGRGCERASRGAGDRRVRACRSRRTRSRRELHESHGLRHRGGRRGPLGGRRSAVLTELPPSSAPRSQRRRGTAGPRSQRRSTAQSLASSSSPIASSPRRTRAIADLRSLGLCPVLLTGDNERAATAVGAEAGIDRVIAGVLPDGKRDVIAQLQREGETVAMVGDGVNDAPALAQADLGLAIGTGTDIAIEASDLTLVSGDLGAAVDAIRLSRRTLRTIKENLFWAFAYNVAAIPLAVAGLLSPVVAAAAMAFSSVFVVLNSLRLRRFHRFREDS